MRRVACYILFTLLALCLSFPYWARPCVSIQFDYESDKDLYYQVFYRGSYEEPFIPRYSVTKLIGKGCGSAEILIYPDEKIRKFRLDVGNVPGVLKIKNLAIVGDRGKVLMDFQNFHAVNITRYAPADNSVSIESKHGDPFIVYKLPVNEGKRSHIQWSKIGMIGFASFYLASVLHSMWLSRNEPLFCKVAPARLQNIEALRILFTLFVLVTHFFGSFKIWSSGGQAVEFFFLLSGYVLALNWKSDRKILDVAIQRYIRFVPLVVFGGLLASGGTRAWLGCLMLQNTGITQGDIPNAPAWYIAVLFWCSLFYMALMKVLNGRKLMLTIAVIGFLAGLMTINCKGGRLDLFAGFLTRGQLLGLFCMALGIYMTSCCRRKQDEIVQLKQHLVYTAFELIVLVYIIWGCFDKNIMLSSWIARPISHVLLLWLFVQKRGYVSSFFERPVFVSLATYSLSIYLTHWLFVITVRRYVLSEYPGWMENHIALSISLAILGSCVVGVLAHHLVEKPCTRYLTNFINWMKEGVVNKVH